MEKIDSTIYVQSLLATRHSPFLFATLYSPSPPPCPPNQRFHMLDVLAADFVGDRPDAGRARHRVPPKKQMVAGADQAGIEQDRIDVAEFAGPDDFGEQAAMEVQ